MLIDPCCTFYARILPGLNCLQPCSAFGHKSLMETGHLAASRERCLIIQPFGEGLSFGPLLWKNLPMEEATNPSQSARFSARFSKDGVCRGRRVVLVDRQRVSSHFVKGTASTDGYKYARVIKKDHGISHCYV